MAQQRIWRVFYTWPRAEKKAETRLEERHIEVFLPKITIVRQWSDRKKKVVEPLFRNYIFAHVDERERLRVLQTDGIVRNVSFNGQPAVVREEEIEQIRIAQNDPLRLSVIDAPPRPPKGTKVVVKEGPLKGLQGDVEQHRGETHLVVRIEAIRQALRVNIPAAWIEEVDE